MDALIAPTAYRLKKHKGDIDLPEISQTTRRYAYRLVGVIDGMHRRGWIRREQADAFKELERQYLKAGRMPRWTGSYGTVIGESDWDPLDIKIDASRKVEGALGAISYPGAHMAMLDCLNEPITLEEIGRRHCHESRKPRALAAGKTLMQVATYQLAVHYGYINTRASPKAA